MQAEIFLPVYALMVLTILVWFYLFAKRIPFINSLEIEPNQLTAEELARRSPPAVSNPSDNLKNLFELPVLFYVLVLMLVVTNQVDDVYVYAAWAYVALRVLHSFVHCTFNHVMLRFMLYAASCLCLFFMVGRAAVAQFL